MQTTKLVRRGMKGRGRDTRLLRLVLTLCFAFITMSSIVLSSTEQTKLEQRIARHGKWQVMLYGADEAQKQALAEAGIDFASGTLIGAADTTRQVGVIDDSYMDLARLALEEGRLPQGENEILLTRAVLEEQRKKVGDELKLVFHFNHVTAGGSVNARSEEVMYALGEQYLEKRGGMKSFIPDFEKWKAEGGRLESNYNYNFAYLPENAEGTSSEMTEEEKYLSDLRFWVYEIENAFYVEAQSARVEPFHDGSMTMSLNYSEQRYRLLGSGFGDDRGKDISYGNDYRSMMMTKSYTISGVVASYTDQWAAGGLELPEAFLSEAGARQAVRGIRQVEESHPDLPRYEPGELVLLYEQGIGVKAMFDKALPHYIDLRRSAYRVDLLERDDWGNLEGQFAGIDQETREERVVTFHGYGDTIYFVYSGEPIELEEALTLSVHPETGAETVIDLRDYGQTTWQRSARLVDLLEGRLSVPYLDPIEPEPITVENARADGDLPLRINSFSYPAEASEVTGSMQGIMEGALSLITLAAVLQVFLTQIRRRARRIALMKALGADNGQVARMLLCEAALLVMFALPIGLAAGLALSRMAIAVMNALDEAAKVSLYLNIPSLAGGLVMGVAAVFIGMALPLYRAVRIPLTGSFEAPVKMIRRPVKQGRRKRQTPMRGVLRNARVNAGRSLGQAALSTLIVLSALSSLYLGHSAFRDYRAQVIDPDRPDYELTAPYGMNARWMRENLDSLQAAVPVLSRVSALVSGSNVMIKAGGSLMPLLLEQADSPLKPASEGLAYPAKVWGAKSDTPLILRLIAEIDAGELDMDAFDKGEEVILIMPRYRQEKGGIRYSLNPADKRAYNEEGSIKPGDILKAETLDITVSEAYKTVMSIKHEVRVGAVIYDISLPGLWPFSGDPQPFTMVGDPRLVTRFYPDAAMRVTPDRVKSIKAFARLYSPDQYGETSIYAYGGEEARRESGDVTIYNFARRSALDLHSWRPANEAMRSLAVNNMMLAAMLGSFVFLVAAVILSNNLGLAVEQERRRIGVLQAMGLRRGQMMRAQAAWGAIIGLTAVAAANLLLLAALVLGTIGSGDVWGTLVNDTLRGYPFLWHGLLCLAFIPLSALLHLQPLMPVLRRSAVENISEQG